MPLGVASLRYAARALRILPVLILVAVGAALYYGVVRSQPREGFYSGVVETTRYELAFEVPGRLEAYEVDEGATVRKGQEVVRLVPADLEAQLEAATARQGIARAQLAALENGTRPEEIEQARARLDKAEADLERLRNGPTLGELESAEAQAGAAREAYELKAGGYRREDVASARAAAESAHTTLLKAQKDLQRFRRLHQEGAIPTKTLDDVEKAHATARAQYESAAQNYQKLSRGYQPDEVEAARQEWLSRQARYEDLAAGTRRELVEAARADVDYWRNQVALAVQGPRAEDVQAARKRLQEATAAVETARLQRAKAALFAPSDGVVLTRNFEDGEMVQPGVSVLTMADLGSPWVEIFVPETEIGQVRLGDRFEVTVDSLPGKAFAGKVTRIYEKAEYTPKTIQTQRERVNLVFRVKVSVENPDLALKPGMPADARRVGPDA